MTNEEWEIRLRRHGEFMRETVHCPVFRTAERRKTTSLRFARVAILAAVMTCILAFSAFAAYRYYSAAELADRVHDKRLSQRFQNADVLSETVESGDYLITLLGSLAGTDISDIKSHGGAKLIAYAAIERADGGDMSYDDHIVVSPLYGGMEPSEANAYTDGGSGWYFLEDGVLYYAAEMRCRLGYEEYDLYLAVSDAAPGAWNYLCDEKSGKITPNPDYSGVNALFLLQKAE